MTPQIAKLIGITIVLGVNFLWYGAKIFLNARGVPVGWLSGHHRDFGSLRRVAATSINPADRARALLLYRALWAGVVLFILVGVPCFFWGSSRSH